MPEPIRRKESSDFPEQHKVSRQEEPLVSGMPGYKLYNTKAPLDFDASTSYTDASTKKVDRVFHRFF